MIESIKRDFPQKNHSIFVNKQGQVDAQHLEYLLKKHDGMAFVSVMAANNETGVLQPLEDIAKIVHQYGGILHCDASQLPARLPISMLPIDLDMITLSGHKMGALQGIGALLFKKHITVNSLWAGGGQEGFFRPGTVSWALSLWGLLWKNAPKHGKIWPKYQNGEI